MTFEHFLALAVVALAAYRVTRVIVEDTITASFRTWLWRHAYQPAGYDARADREVATRRSWAWEKAYQLFTCPFCTGWWVTIAFYVAWFGWPRSTRDVVRLAATIGLQALLSSRPGA